MQTWLDGSSDHSLFRALLVLAALLGTLSFACAAHSQPQGARIAILGIGSEDAVGRQLEAELISLGLVVVPSVPWTQGNDLAALEREARRLNVAAAIWIGGVDASSAELVVVDRVTAKSLHKRLDVSDQATSELRARVLVARAIELLRASLRELQERDQLPPRAVEPSAALRALVEPSPARVRVAAGSTLLASSGGVPASFGLWLAAQYRLRLPVALELGGAVPLGSTEITAAEGSAEVSTLLLNAAALWEPLPARSSFRPQVGLESGAAVVRMMGSGAAPLRDGSDTVVAAVALTRAGASILVSKSLRLRADARLGLSVPEVSVLFAERVAATWGRPLLLLSAGLELELD